MGNLMDPRETPVCCRGWQMDVRKQWDASGADGGNQPLDNVSAVGMNEPYSMLADDSARLRDEVPLGKKRITPAEALGAVHKCAQGLGGGPERRGIADYDRGKPIVEMRDQVEQAALTPSDPVMSMVRE